MKNKQAGFNLLELLLIVSALTLLVLMSIITTTTIKNKKLLRTYLSDVQLEHQEYFVKKGNFFISKDKHIVNNICWVSQNLRNNVFKEAGYEILVTLNNQQQALLNDDTCEKNEFITSVIISKNLNSMTGNSNTKNSEKIPENLWSSTDRL